MIVVKHIVNFRKTLNSKGIKQIKFKNVIDQYQIMFMTGDYYQSTINYNKIRTKKK